MRNCLLLSEETRDSETCVELNANEFAEICLSNKDDEILAFVVTCRELRLERFI